MGVKDVILVIIITIIIEVIYQNVMLYNIHIPFSYYRDDIPSHHTPTHKIMEGTKKKKKKNRSSEHYVYRHKRTFTFTIRV